MTPDYKTVEITGFILEEQTELTLADLCRACAAEADRIIELVNEGVLAPADAPSSHPPDQWHFSGVHLQRARVALRLQNDLGINPAGSALALELLDELDSLRTRLRLLEGK